MENSSIKMQQRLKSLELQGYKTFASRANFEFPGKITAVVGPNGSGKSNIADSARWVLGEQAYSLLRARKTEDMIFSGSDQRPKSGMASATITFSNEDGWLPIDYNEVSITRRAYRDGQNEYLINGQRVRLKEINELLGNSGLSERTYTIIGQGLVDTALSLHPAERRKFFEEAAGIGLYRTRRDEAINRLDVTRRNLERAQDILGELVPRLTSLEKQARKVREYQQIQDGLHELLREWYGYHWHRIQAEVIQQRQVVKAQEDRLEQARTKAVTVEASMTDMRKTLNTLREEIGVLHTKSAALHSDRERISRELAVMDERKKSLSAQMQSLQTEHIHLEEEQQTTQERLASLQSELKMLQDEVDQAQSQLELESGKLAEAQKSRSVIELQLADVRRRIIAHETQKAQKKAQAEELKVQSGRYLQQQENLLKKIAEIEPALQVLQNQQNENLQRSHQCNKGIEQCEHDVASLRDELQKLEEKRRKSQDERTSISSQISRLNAQLEVVAQAEKALSGWGQGARSVLESVQKGKLTGKFRTLISDLQIPEKLEKAVSAVLGEYLESIVIEAPDTLDNVLVLIEKEKTNRVMLVLPESSSDGKKIPLPEGNGIIGFLEDQIHATDNIRPLIRQICENTVLVESRQIAYQLTRNTPSTMRVVTLAGEVFAGKNTVIAGETSSQNLLARPRLLKEISNQISEQQTALEKMQVVLGEVELGLKEKRQAEHNAQDQLGQLRKERERIAHRNQELTLQVSKMQQQLDWNRNQLNQIAIEMEKSNLTDETLQNELASMVEAGKKLEEQQSLTLKALSEHNLDELTSQVNYWKTTLAVTQRSLQDAQRRKQEYGSTSESNAQRIRFTSERMEKLQTETQELETQRTQALSSADSLSQEISSLQLAIDPQELSLKKMESDYDQQLSNQIAIQQGLSVAERYFSQAQIELNRKNEELSSLQRRVEDDFGLVAFQYTTEITGPTPLPFGEFVEQLPEVKLLKSDLEDSITRQRALLKRMGAINPEAQNEYEEVKQRHDFLESQMADLQHADEDLRQIIQELDELMQQEFRKTFDAVAAEFKHLFTRLFGGGSARLVLVEGEKINEEGIDIEARLPGRREQGLSLLSGGERSLTAVALIFALLKVSPTPFCILDEVDAMLDEANVGRFCELLQELSTDSQFIVITHNRNTVQIADVIYGVTMGRDSASQVISLRIDQLSEEMVR